MRYVLNGHETERLTFRLLKKSDFESWLDLFTTPNVAKFLTFDPSLSPTELCAVWFEKVFYRYDNNLGGMNVLVSKETDQMVGQCGLLVQEVDGMEELEIGYSVLPQFWGHGYATEAAHYCKHVAFAEHYADSLISLIHPENIASKKVALKNGMTLEKSSELRGVVVDVFRVLRNQALVQK